MTVLVARQASGHMAIASPQPLTPCFVSTRRRTVMRSWLKSFGSGQRRIKACIFEIFTDSSPIASDPLGKPPTLG